MPPAEPPLSDSGLPREPNPQNNARPAYPTYGPRPAQAFPHQPAPMPYAAPYPQYPMGPMKATSGKAIASIVLMGVSVFLSPLAIITGIASIITGVMALKETRPADAKTGRGLAIGGIAGSSIMIVIWLGMAAIFALVIAAAPKLERAVKQAETESRKPRADRDMRLILDRLNLYYNENRRSLKPGGPIVTSGWEHGIYDESAPRVTGPALKLEHLVLSEQLELHAFNYELVVNGENAATIRCDFARREMRITDVDKRTSTLRDLP